LPRSERLPVAAAAAAAIAATATTATTTAAATTAAATAAAAAAVTAATTTVAATATATAASRGALTRLVDPESATVDISTVAGRNGRFAVGGRTHLDEREATGLTRFAIHDDRHAVDYPSVFFEHLPQCLLVRRVRQVSHIELAHDLSANSFFSVPRAGHFPDRSDAEACFDFYPVVPK
jgi:hypothetical protein